jgi:hypothetical protein
MTITVDVEGVARGADTSFTMDGAVDFAANRGRFSLDLGASTAGLVAGKAEVLFDGSTIYFRFPPQITSQLDGGQTWLKLDLAAFGDEVGVDLESLASVQSSDPTTVLQYLRGSGEVTEVGREQVRGVDTTRYRATLDLTKAREHVREEARQAYDQATAQLGVDTLPADVWVDEEGRLRKLTFAVDLSKVQTPSDVQASGTYRMTMELYDFGTDVELQLPPPERVGDLAELTRRERGSVGS